MTLIEPNVSIAQNVSDSESCADGINNAVASEVRLFRAVLYGMPKAEKAPVGSLRYDGGGNPWIKTDDSQWKSIDDEIDNNQMDARAEFEDRQGLFQTHRVLTSELLPFLMQSMYALDCRLQAVCSFAEQSFSKDEVIPMPLEVQPEGCINIEGESIVACHLKKDDNNSYGQQGQVTGYCEQMAQETLLRQKQMLKVAAEYDAAYRAMLQFAGEFDLFLANFRTPIENSVRQTAGIIGWMNKIPCFTSSCADYPLEP